jgi:hypothetical protein
MKNKSDESTRKRHRRTIEEQIADLEKEKAQLLERLKAKELKASPAHKTALLALRQIDKALEAAAEEGERELQFALAGARQTLGEHMEKRGVRLPRARLPRGPRPRE